jgi:hypothetical protein
MLSDKDPYLKKHETSPPTAPPTTPTSAILPTTSTLDFRSFDFDFDYSWYWYSWYYFWFSFGLF